jgi:predicted O-methyltransferase YrrM
MIFSQTIEMLSRVFAVNHPGRFILNGQSRRKQAPQVTASDGSKADLDAVFRSIGITGDHATMDFSGLTRDLQGWESRHRIFQHVFETYRPAVVVEVGTWKGASILHMDQLSQRLGCDTRFICVDTWLGSNDSLWLDPEFRKSLMLRDGYPSMFRQFVFNVKQQGATKRIYPLPMTSTCGAYLLRRLNVMADAIYVDAGHEEDEVHMDLTRYYDILKPGGVMFGDDYSSDWQGVIDAVDRFCAERNIALTVDDGKWLFEKPRDAVEPQAMPLLA